MLLIRKSLNIIKPVKLISLLFSVIAGSFLCAQGQIVDLYIGEIGTTQGVLEIRMNNHGPDTVCGFQFSVDGINITGVTGISYPLPLSVDNDFISGNLSNCGDIPVGDNTLMFIYYDDEINDEACLINPIILDGNFDPCTVNTGPCYVFPPPLIFLQFGELDTLNHTLDIVLETLVNTDGGVFTFSGIHITDVIPGLCQDCGQLPFVFNNSVGFLTFLMWCPPMSGVYFTLVYDEFTDEQVCFMNAYMAAQTSLFWEPAELPDCLTVYDCSVMGDQNDDSQLDILDVILIVNCVIEYSFCPCSDFNGDELTDVLDIVAMVDEILNA